MRAIQACDDPDSGVQIVKEAVKDGAEVTLTEVLITAVSTGGSGGEDRLTENVTLNFAKVKFSYTEQDPQGKPKTPDKAFTFNIAENVSE